MTSRKPTDFGLLTAGILTAGMGAYHFFLPVQFGWAEALAHDPMLRWALLSINAFFSYLLLAGGLLTIAIAARPAMRAGIGAWLLLAMSGFWIMNGAYQVLLPMPLPHRLWALKWILLAFALVVAALYVNAARPRANKPT
jgi:hypothetical protein